jgi:hypothetical protein
LEGCGVSVTNGQNANQTTFNNAFLSRTADTSTTGKVDLNNADGASGASVTNTQREVNSLNSFTGRSSGSVFNAKPSWTSNDVGVSTDDLKTRVDLLTALFNEITGHTHDNSAGQGGPLVEAASGVSGILNASGQTISGIKYFESGIISSSVEASDFLSAVNQVYIELEDDSTSTGADAVLGPYSKFIINLTNASLTSIANIDLSANIAWTIFVVTNNTGNQITIKNKFGGTGEIITGTGAAINLADEASLFCYYDEPNDKVYVIGGTGGGAGGAFVNDTFTGTTITPSADGFQKWSYTGGSAQTLASIDTSSLDDGYIINILGTSDTNTLTIDYSDTSEGFLINGTWVAYRGSLISLQWDVSLDRFVEVSRNG